jgi:hypothetical protein
MSWHFLQGLEAASWEGSCSAGAPSALSSLIPTAAACCSPGNATGCSSAFRSGMTSGASTARPGADTSTSSAAGSPAKTSLSPAAAKGSTVSVPDSGLSLLASLARFDPVTCSWRTGQLSLLGDSAEYSATWPPWGLMLDGVCWVLSMSQLRTSGTACGLPLPTPTARDWRSGKASEETHARNSRPLNEVLEREGLTRLLPTPTAQLYGSNWTGVPGRRLGKKRPSLETLAGGVFIALREWMMGWPIGWSGLEPLATDRFQQWLDSHGRHCIDHDSAAICDRCTEQYETNGFGFPHASHQPYPGAARGSKVFRTPLRHCGHCGQIKHWHEWAFERAACVACTGARGGARCPTTNDR